MQYHFFLALSEGVQENIESFSWDMLSGPANAERRVTCVGLRWVDCMSCFEPYFVHQKGISMPIIVDFSNSLCGAGQDGVAVCSCSFGAATPALMEIVDDIPNSKVQGAFPS